jgi:hypothetical protein
LFERKNHKIASVVRFHARPLEFIKPQIIRKKAIISRRRCQILIPLSAGKNALFLLCRILKKIEALRSKLQRMRSLPNSNLPPHGRKSSRHAATTLRYTRHIWCENELFTTASLLTKGELLCFKMYS